MLAAKIKWCEKHRERLLKLQSRITYSATSNHDVKPPTSGDVQPPVSHPQPSSSAKAHATPPVSPMPPDTCFNAACTTFSSGISCCMENQVNEQKNDDSATTLGILHLRSMAKWETVVPKELVDAFDANVKNSGREIGSCHGAYLKRRNNRKNQNVDVCNRHPGGFIRSLGRYRNGIKDKLDKWMGDLVTKRQPAPDGSLPFRVSRAFVRYIHKNYANNVKKPRHVGLDIGESLHVQMPIVRSRGRRRNRT